jgi:hypothetical protein
MNKEILESLLFYSLKEDFSLDDLKKKFTEFVFKYHPDRGEYTSNAMIIEVYKHKEILENFLIQKIETTKVKETLSDYEIYKKAKKLENDTILTYFKKRNLNLNKTSPDLEYEIELKKKLTEAKVLYETILTLFPHSIWCSDSKDSIHSIENWLRDN